MLFVLSKRMNARLGQLLCWSWVTMGIFLLATRAAAVPALPVINTNNVVLVTSSPFNAVGDGITTNTTAIQNAINAAAAGGTTNGAAGGTVEIPPGVYMCGPLTMASAVNLQIDAGAILRMLPLGMYSGGITTGTTFISASNLHDIEISGAGAIDGQGAPWWPYANTNGALRPIMIQPNSCNRLLIQGLTLSNSPMFHIAIGGKAANSTVNGVTVLAPSSTANPPSHNTDACDVSGTNTLVENCHISTGDDDFTCGGGTANVVLTNNTYGNGHGISIGSYTDDGGVSGITVINCTMNGTQNGIRIKSDNDRGGLVQDISYINISMTNVELPIQVYSYYNEVGTPVGVTPLTAATEPVAAVTGTTPVYRNITFSNITATAVSGYPIGIVWARTEMPATNIVFEKMNLTGYQNFCLYNVSGAQFVDSTFHLPAGITNFAMFNSSVVITNSVYSSSLLNFDGLTTNGYGDGFTFYNASAALRNTNAFGAGPLSLSDSTLAVGNSLTLFPATTINYTLGMNTAKLAVSGNLALGGTNNIFAGGGFTTGAYAVMTYTGSLSGSAPVLGSVPAGYNYAFDTSTAGIVYLDVLSTNLTVPGAPVNLTATASNQIVMLTWSPAITATSYVIGRSTTNNGTYPTIFSGIVTTNYSDIQVTNGTTYYYVVAAANSAGTGTNSTAVSATPQVPVMGVINETVFQDTFSASTVDSSPMAPTTAATSYEVISSKDWNPTPSVAAGHLKFGIGTTTSGGIEIQALFTNSPVTLANVGDTLFLTVIFTDTSGLLTQSGAMGFGVYHSSGNDPVPDGLNGTATTSATANATGNAQTWAGYVGQVSFTGSSSQILTRAPQTGAYDNNQDLVTTGSGSSSYDNPAAAGVGTASSTGSVTLTAMNSYTEVLALALTATNTLGITNFLYAGTSTNSIPISQFGGPASGATFLTSSFDALAIGWRVTASTAATAIDINQISVNASLVTPVTVSLNPPSITAQMVGGQWQLSWPADHLGWRLQAQTNSLDTGLGTNWSTVANSTNVDQVTVGISSTNGAVFYRLIYP